MSPLELTTAQIQCDNIQGVAAIMVEIFATKQFQTPAIVAPETLNITKRCFRLILY